MDTRFSVVIPACDRVDTVREAVDSVLRQTLEPMEILIIDNGNVALSESIFPVDDRIRIIRALPRFGVAQARNVGAVLASGTYLAFLDDDDRWDRFYLQEMAKCADASHADVMLGSLRSMSDGAVLKGKSLPIDSMNDLRKQILLRNPGAVGSNTVISRSVFMRCRGYDPYLTTGQDKAIVLDLVLAGSKVVRAHDAWVDFRVATFGERQTEVVKRIRGKKRFMAKYWSRMSWMARSYNFAHLVRLYIHRLLGVRV